MASVADHATSRPIVLACNRWRDEDEREKHQPTNTSGDEAKNDDRTGDGSLVEATTRVFRVGGGEAICWRRSSLVEVGT